MVASLTHVAASEIPVRDTLPNKQQQRSAKGCAAGQSWGARVCLNWKPLSVLTDPDAPIPASLQRNR
jgi:hypothetical protein